LEKGFPQNVGGGGVGPYRETKQTTTVPLSIEGSNPLVHVDGGREKIIMEGNVKITKKGGRRKTTQKKKKKKQKKKTPHPEKKKHTHQKKKRKGRGALRQSTQDCQKEITEVMGLSGHDQVFSRKAGG